MLKQFASVHGPGHVKRLASLVYLVCLVELETNQMNKTNQMNHINSSRLSRAVYCEELYWLDLSDELTKAFRYVVTFSRYWRVSW